MARSQRFFPVNPISRFSATLRLGRSPLRTPPVRHWLRATWKRRQGNESRQGAGSESGTLHRAGDEHLRHIIGRQGRRARSWARHRRTISPVLNAHLGGLDLLMVMVTHTHSDHAPAANVLGSRWDVDVLGFGPGPEFEPDVLIADGDRLAVGDAVLEALHTPGHTADHVCYRIADVIFTGDHIMGGSTVVIEDASSYMRSLKRVADLSPESLYPGHGPFMADASAAITDYIEHRLARENEIVAAIERGAGTIGEIVAVVYAEVDPALRMAAAQQVGSNYKKLESDGRIELEWPPFGEGPRCDEPRSLRRERAGSCGAAGAHSRFACLCADRQ